MKYIYMALIFIGFIVLAVVNQPRLKAFNAQQCAVYGLEADCKTKEQRLCENYYNHTCTVDGELPEGVVIIK